MCGYGWLSPRVLVHTPSVSFDFAIPSASFVGIPITVGRDPVNLDWVLPGTTIVSVWIGLAWSYVGLIASVGRWVRALLFGSLR